MISSAFAAALIVLGLGWLLVKWEILSSGEACEAIRLWPLSLVLIGLEMFLRGTGRRAPWLVGAGAVFAGTLVIWLIPGIGSGYGASGDVAGNISVSTGNQVADSALAVELSVGALELTIDGQRQDNVTVNYTGIEPRLKEEGAEIVIAGRESRWGGCGRIGGQEAKWDVSLPLDRPIDLHINAGAAEIVADLSHIDLTRLEIDAGAAEILVRLPSRAGETEVEFDTGASDITIEVPSGVAVKLTSDSALSSTQFTGLELIKRGDAMATDDFDTASSRVVIDIDSAVSDITVRRR
jgi:hypothetical protein